SCRSPAERQAMLCDCAHILRAIGETLLRRESRYAEVFAALLTLSGESGLDHGRARANTHVEPAIDDDWAEQPAFAKPDGGKDAGGGRSTLHFIPPRQV
ncbi:MAG: hypothetical protein ACREX6_06715, partial [Casimicrobiaceae bacterium]